MTIRFVVPGQPDPRGKDTTRGGQEGVERRNTDLLDNVETVDAYTLSPSARARAKSPETLVAEEDDILEIEVEGGFTLWTSAERYRHDLAVLRPEAVRDGEVPIDVLPHARASERGVSDWIASALRVLRLRPDAIDTELVDPGRWNEFAREVGLGQAVAAGAWATTKFALWLIERRLPCGEGLYRFDDVARETGDAPAAPPQPAGIDDAEQPILIFIHGTASSSKGSFGALLEPAAQSDWRAMQRRLRRTHLCV